MNAHNARATLDAQQPAERAAGAAMLTVRHVLAGLLAIVPAAPTLAVLFGWWLVVWLCGWTPRRIAMLALGRDVVAIHTGTMMKTVAVARDAPDRLRLQVATDLSFGAILWPSGGPGHAGEGRPVQTTRVRDAEPSPPPPGRERARDPEDQR
jgi:hypothetical protein